MRRFVCCTAAAAVLLSAAAILLSTRAVSDELQFQAYWQPGTGINIFSPPEPRAAFLARGAKLTAQGLRIADIATAVIDGERVYSALWVSGTGSSIFVGPMGPIQLREERKVRAAEGLRLNKFLMFRTPEGGRRYVGIWGPGNGEDHITHPMPENEFIARGHALTARGFRLVSIVMERFGGHILYSGLWHQGTGSNFFSAARPPAAFRAFVEQMAADGLDLIDVARIGPSGNERFAGVFAAGEGKGTLSAPRDLSAFRAFGSEQAQAGLRTRAMAMFVVEQSKGGGKPPSPDPTATDADLPDLPRWIKLSNQARLIIDWSLMVETEAGHRMPQMTVPIHALPLHFLPFKNEEKDIVFPDAFCGMNITKVGSINWMVGGNVIAVHPFNHVPQVEEFDQLNGIEFSGPIGSCEGSNKGWDFPTPITQTGPFEPLENMMLILDDLGHDAEIRFISHQPPVMKPVSLYSNKVFATMEKMAKMFYWTLIDNGYCGIDRYLQKICEDEGRNHPKCLVGADFASVSPC